MPYPPIYHLRCNSCHAAYVAVVWDLQCCCFSCERTDWRIVEVWLRHRTPWVDVPAYGGLRLFPVSTPAGFLERLSHAVAYAREDPSYGTFVAAPGLSRTRTLHHTPQCQWDAGRCDGECPEAVTYTPVAITAN